MRILLTEGSGLTSRQVAGRLGALGHEVEILSSAALCLTRFTRHVRAVHAVPRFGLDPFGWLDVALGRGGSICCFRRRSRSRFCRRWSRA
jgi:hypothetical protein